MKFELFGNRFVMGTRRKCKAQAASDALKETAGLGHQYSDAML